jgi:hypothetical protein
LIKFFVIFIINFFSLFSQQAWAPYQRQLWIRPMVTHSEYNSAYLANSFAKFDDNIRITTGSIALEYGITDRLTIDGTFGFGRLGRHKIFNRYLGFQQTPEVPDKYGFLDSRIGIRYKIFDEFDTDKKWLPTISIRVGGIKKGDYDRTPQALGDGANGGEVHLLLAKDFGFWGLGTLGELGYRKREKPVPDDILYYGAFYKRFNENYFLTLGGRGQFGQEGYAFADPRQEPPWNYFKTNNLFEIAPGFNLADYWVNRYRPPWGRKEDFHYLQIGLGYMDSFGNFYNIFYSETLSGYNTANLRTAGFLVNMPFNL